MKCDHKIRSIPSRWIKIMSTLPVLTYSSHSWRKSLEGKAHLRYIRSMTLDVVESGEKYTVRGKKKYTKLRGISELGQQYRCETKLSERIR